MLEVLRYPYELRAADGLDLPGGDVAALGVTDAELALARQLVATIETDWDPSAYHDTYHDDLLALIQRKAAGETVEVAEARAEPLGEVVDIMELLKKSVEDARAAKAGGAQAAGA